MCPFSSPMATLRLMPMGISVIALACLRSQAHLWSESVAEKATAVAASAVLMTVTGVHFPSRFFQIFTYSVT